MDESAGQEIVARDDAYSVSQGSVLQADGQPGMPQGVMANDDGVADLAAVRIAVLDPPQNGQLVLQADGTFSYTPHQNFHGVDRFNYSVESVGSPSVALIDSLSEWKYLNPFDGRAPDFDDPDFDQTWFLPGFDETTWLDGSGVMGYGGVTGLVTNIGTPENGQRMSAYFRTRFTVPEEASGRLEAIVRRDDAAIIYLDGLELGRTHQPGAKLVGSVTDDYFLFVEGNSTAWTADAAEAAEFPINIEEFTLSAGEHVIAASVHNNLNSTAFTSSDLGFGMGLTLHAQSRATVEITVSETAVPPSIEPDVFFIAGDTEFDSAALGRNLYTNDGLLDESGELLTPVLDLMIDDSITDGDVLGNSAATGDFSFLPVNSFRGTTTLTYQVVTVGGTSETRQIYLVVVDPDEVVQESYRGLATSGIDVPLPLSSAQIGVITQPRSGQATLQTRSNPPLLSYQPTPFVGEEELAIHLHLKVFPLLSENVTWSYLNPQNGLDPELSDPDFDSTWFLPGFNFDAWPGGSGQFAAGTISGAQTDTPLQLPAEGDRFTAYFRVRFNADADQLGGGGRLLIARDDGAIVYLNGVEIGRTPESFTGDDDYFLMAPGAIGGDEESEAVSVEFPPGILVPGANFLAVSVHNADTSSSDLGFRCDGLIAYADRVALPIRFEVGSPIAEWRRSSFDDAQLLDPAVSSASADPDRDQLVNLMEHIYGTNPLVADNFNEVTGLGFRIVNDSHQPLLKLPDEIPGDTIVELQVSPDLTEGSWTTQAIRYPGHRWVSSSGIAATDAVPSLVEIDERSFARFVFSLQPWATDVPR